MKKILIVNNNLEIGGIQKSLVNLLKALHGTYDITLLLFSKTGALLEEVPADVKIVTPARAYRILGMGRMALKRWPELFFLKAFLIVWTKLFSSRSAMKWLGLFQKKISGYDVVISYSHLPHHKYLGNGCGDFVLDKTVCDQKICLIHCDYPNSGCMTDANTAKYGEFDKIACCSASVMERFLQHTGDTCRQVYTLRNFYDPCTVTAAADQPYVYDENFINLLTVARLSKVKGIDRAIEALRDCGNDRIRYYVAGGGPEKEALLARIREYGLENRVFLLGEQTNPFRYMAGADYLLLPSYHEAAPMVFDEAKILGLPVITTATTSAREMIGSAGIVCENSTAGIRDTLRRISKDFSVVREVCTNTVQEELFRKLIQDDIQ